MIVWRVTHARHARSAWSGDGARLRGGRWNSPGRPAIYASDHAALSVLETLVRLAPADLAMFRLFSGEIPGASVETLPPEDLPSQWDAHPHHEATQALGDAWLAAGEALALRVPSSLVPGDNVLINPAHAAFPKLRPRSGPQPIPFAARLARS